MDTHTTSVAAADSSTSPVARHAVQSVDQRELAAELTEKYADMSKDATFAAATHFNRLFHHHIPEDIGIDLPGGEDEFSQLVSLENIFDHFESEVILLPTNPDGSIRDPRFEKEIMSTEAQKARRR